MSESPLTDLGVEIFGKQLADLTHEEFLTVCKVHTANFMFFGAIRDWWDLNEKGECIQKPITVSRKNLPDNATMANVLHEAGVFKSISEARRNGWQKPIVDGLLELKNGRIRIFVTE